MARRKNAGLLVLELFSLAVQLRQAVRRAKYRYMIETNYLKRQEVLRNAELEPDRNGLHLAECMACGYLATPPFIGEDCPECGTILEEVWLK